MNFYSTLILGFCSIQKNLRFNMSNRSIPDGLPIFNPNETLGQAICCDSRYLGFAEKRWTFNDSDINLFSFLNTTGYTYFYDSKCGIPLFKVPVGRTLTEFKNETLHHGWPSFHDEEIISTNGTLNIHNMSNSPHVQSKCGTQLGDNLPENGKNRYCLDLVCISGHPID